MTTGLYLTAAGRAAIAADLSGGADLTLSHMAWGDANGVPYTPGPAVDGMVALVNERYRAPLSSVGVASGEIQVEAVFPADTPDASARPSHGFVVHELGVFNASNVLVGVARMGGQLKPAPGSGQVQESTVRASIAVANPGAISVTVSPSAQTALGRLLRAGWITVDGRINAPPANPAAGATYIVGPVPTGAWTGQAHRLAQWNGSAWALASVPTGHLACDNSQAETHAERFLKRTADSWVSALATTTAAGFTRLATAAEAATGTSPTAVPALAQLRSAMAAQQTVGVIAAVNNLLAFNTVSNIPTIVPAIRSSLLDPASSFDGTVLTVAGPDAGVWNASIWVNAQRNDTTTLWAYVMRQVGGTGPWIQEWINGDTKDTGSTSGMNATVSGPVVLAPGDKLKGQVFQQNVAGLSQTVTGKVSFIHAGS